LEKESKESQQKPHALDNVREEDGRANEDLREEQKSFFTQLNAIQDYQDEIIILFDQLGEIKSQYIETKHAFDKIIYWQERHEETPVSLFQFMKKE